MIAPVRVHRPQQHPIPLVLDSPHSGTAYPEDFDHAPPRPVVRQAEDTFVAELYAQLVRMHGRPQERRHSVQIEINRKLYMDEATLEKHAGFETLRSNLGLMLEAMRGFIVERLDR